MPENWNSSLEWRRRFFQQPLRDGGFVDLEEEGIPDADGESEPYEPSVGEPEGEVSVPQSNASPQEEIASEITTE